MNIAYVASCNIPSRAADSIHIMKMCSALADILTPGGGSVTLIVPEYPAIEPDIDNVFDFYGVKENFGIKKIAIKLPKMKSKHIRRALKIAHYAAKGKYDRIYSRYILACYFITKVFRKDIYFEYHSSFVKNSMYERMFSSMISSKHFKKMVVITNTLKHYFITNYNLDDNQIYIAPDCADMPPEDLTPAKLIDSSQGMFHAGYIGQLYQGKGAELFGDIAKSCPFAFLHIIGGNEADINYWKEKYKEIDNIYFYGFVPPSETAGYGMCMDALIAPYQRVVSTELSSRPEDSIADWMSPLKLFEYMALKKPIITSDLPVLKEVMTDGVNGLLCAPDNASAWCKAIERLNEDKKLSETLAENAYASFKEHYTWQARAGNLLKYVIID